MKRRMYFLKLYVIALIVLSVGLLLFSRLYAKNAQAAAAVTVSKIETLLPPATSGVPGEYSDPEMPALQVDGCDYIGLLRFPAYGVSLPIAGQWSDLRILSCPCRFYGSVYDSTMIIGGNDQQGQFDFFDRMDLGDKVVLTDMMGTEFTYTVERIDRAKSADYETLSSGEYPLTLFVRSAYSMKYIFVRCSLPT